jgi:nucleoside-diphosphate-sugar epimerase
MMTREKKKILITGASGFVGFHVARHAQEQGHDVVTPTHTELPLENRDTVQSFVGSLKPDVIVHLATSIIASGKTADPTTLVQTNIQGTINLMDAAVETGVKAFINTGTFAEYGPKDHPVKEDERCDPMELYAMSKLSGTLYGQGLARRTGFLCVTLRLFTPYGPNMKETSLVRSVIVNTLAGNPVKLTKPTMARDFVYVEDATQLYFEAVEKAEEYKGQIFNVGSGNRTTLKELVETVELATGKKAQTEWGAFTVQSYDSELWQANMDKTFSSFDWRPKTTLSEGIQRTVGALDS